MIFFNLKDLENRLIKNSVSEKEGFYYLLAYAILSSLATYGAYDFYYNDLFLAADIILMVIITVIGLYLTFKTNQKGDGKKYLKRYLSLSFVIAVRLLVFTLLLVIPITIILALAFEGGIGNKLFSDLMEVGAMTIFGVIYYYFLVRSFKKVAQLNSQ